MKNIYVLPTDKPSRLHLAYNMDFYLSIEPFVQLDITNYKSFNIYITSDEEIKEGDWSLNTEQNIIAKCIRIEELSNGYYNGKKVILTTDPILIAGGVQAIPDEFLEWFVKNPSCEEVEVEHERVLWGDGRITHHTYKIIIPKEETKQETFLGKTISKKDADKDSFEDVTKYKIEKGYSEEEVEDIAKDAYAMGRKGILIGVFNKWFEQFKNK